jgi:hypothetical protein
MEETERGGQEPAEDNGASPSGEAAFGISIDMTLMPNLPRTGRERSVVFGDLRLVLFRVLYDLAVSGHFPALRWPCGADSSNSIRGRLNLST